VAILQQQLDDLRMVQIRLDQQSSQNLSTVDTLEYMIKDTEKTANDMAQVLG